MPISTAAELLITVSQDNLPVEELLSSLFETPFVGVALYKPVFARTAPDQIEDFEFVLLNAKAQQILRLPARPAGSYLHHYPYAREAGVFDFQCRAFASGQQERFEVNYQADQLDDYFLLSARRVGALLLVTFTDTADQSRTAVEEALRASQAREQAARADAEVQRASLYNTFMEAPAMITIFKGPEHVFSLVNPLYQQLVGQRPLLGLPIREAMPELAGQPIFDLLDNVYQTGTAFYATEMLVQLDHDNSHPDQLEQRYYNFIYQPSRDAAGTVDGILVFAYDVTVQVQARQRVEESEGQLRHLNEQLADSIEELQAANEEIRANNEELFKTQLALQQLNQELETRVLHRTQEAQDAQQEAEHQQRRLENIFMHAPAAICILTGPEMVYELVNPRYQQLFPGRHLLGQPIGKAIPELTTQPIWGILHHTYRTGETMKGQEVLVQAARYADGPTEDIYFNFTYQARRSAAGAVDGILVFAYEVTDQVLARRRVEQREQEFRTLTNAIPHLVWTATPAGETNYYNDQWYAYTGSSPASNPDFFSCFHPHDLPALQQRWQEALHNGQPWQLEARLRNARGTYRWFLVRCLPLPDEQGTITRWFGTNTDIHEQKELAEALQLASRKLAASNKDLRAANDAIQVTNTELAFTNEQLTRINQDLDNFVYTASHDLKQPVNNLAGVFDELKRTATFHDPEALLLVDMFERALKQIHDTIFGLTQVVQAERQAGYTPAETVALLPLTQGIIQSMQSQVAAQQAEFRLDFGAVPELHFARLNLQSILYNLLSNALRYAHPERPPMVQVTTERSPDGAPVLVVQDNGLGIDLERFGPDLFKMFRRFHNHVAGSGLGLYLVHRIVQQAGGRITVESQVDAGTSFRVYLPGSGR